MVEVYCGGMLVQDTAVSLALPVLLETPVSPAPLEQLDSLALLASPGPLVRQKSCCMLNIFFSRSNS